MKFWQRHFGLVIFALVMIAFLVLQGMVVILGQRNTLNTLHHERMEDDLNLIAMMAHESILKHDHVTVEKVLTRWAETEQDIVELTAVAANGFVLAHYRNFGKGEGVQTHVREIRQQDDLLLRIQIQRTFNRTAQDVFRLSVQLALLSILLMVMLGVLLRWVLWFTAVQPLEEEIRKRQDAEEQGERIRNIHAAINDLLRLTLQPVPLHQQLKQALNKLLAIPWLAIEAKGAIFLANREQSRLQLVVQQGLEEPLLDSCREIAFGQCLCGRAAVRRKLLFVDHLDEQHDIRFEGQKEHGHYCVPIVSNEEVLGVISLYVAKGYAFAVQDSQFLEAVANTLEGLILRQRSEDALQQLNAQLEMRVALRTAELQTSLEKLHIARDQLYQAEKMAALGRLVAGVAHEINTPLGIGYTASTFLEEQTGEVMAKYRARQLDEEGLQAFMTSAAELSRMILVNLGRAGELIRSFKKVAVDQSLDDLRQIPLHDYCHEILASLRPRLKGPRHQVQITCSPDLTVTSHPGAFFQIITNLVMNSVLHGFEDREEGLITLEIGLAGPNEVMMTYRDNGKGIREADAVKIFEPFYTTRRGQGSSGLGLHIVYNLVTQSLAGSIQCHGRPGQGAEFVLRFPRER